MIGVSGSAPPAVTATLHLGKLPENLESLTGGYKGADGTQSRMTALPEHAAALAAVPCWQRCDGRNDLCPPNPQDQLSPLWVGRGQLSEPGLSPPWAGGRGCVCQARPRG